MADDPSLEQDVASIVERLKLKWLQRMEKMLDENTITSTDLATLARLLNANGWILDPKRLPKGLADKIGDRVDPKSFEDDDPDVIPMNRYGT
jgi:hypothetical protein